MIYSSVSWRGRIGLIAGIFALSFLLLNGCKSQMNNPVFVQSGATNTVVNIDPQATVNVPTGAATFTITNPISIFVTNTPVALSNPTISVLLTSSIAPIQITNVIISAAGTSTCSNCPAEQPKQKCPAQPCEKTKLGFWSFVDRHFGDLTKIIVSAMPLLIAIVGLIKALRGKKGDEWWQNPKVLGGIVLAGIITSALLFFFWVRPILQNGTGMPTNSPAALPPAITLLADAVKTNNARLDGLAAQIDREAAAMRDFIWTNLVPSTTNPVSGGDYKGVDEKFVRLESRIASEAQSIREFIRTNDSATSLQAHHDLARQLADQSEALKRIKQKLDEPAGKKTDCCTCIIIVLIVGGLGYGTYVIRRVVIRVQATRAAVMSEVVALRKMAAQIKGELKGAQPDSMATPEFQRERLLDSVRICSRLVDSLIESWLRLPVHEGFIHTRGLPKLNDLMDANVRLRIVSRKLSEWPPKPSPDPKAPSADDKKELAALAAEVSNYLEDLFAKPR